MQSAATHLPLSSPGPKVIPAFRVLIAYEDLGTGRRARRAFDFLVQNLSHQWQVSSQVWKFELLGMPQLREIAAEDALMAELIIISCRGDRELPANVRTWIELWRGHQGGPVGLIALFDCPPGQPECAQGAQAYLEAVANQTGMEFFTWPQMWLKQGSLRPEQAVDIAQEALLRAAA